MAQYKVKSGWRYPPGATHSAEGTNFSIFSRHAESMELLLYTGAECQKPFQKILLDPAINRTFFFWHIYLEGLPSGTCYTWRVAGPGDVKGTGFRFDQDKELIDPWARIVTDNLWNRRHTIQPGSNSGKSLRAMVAKTDTYDWEGDTHLYHSPEETIIYELHIGGFTRHPSAQVEHPGTYSGLIEKIDYLKELGVTAVELLPVMAFDEQDLPDSGWEQGLRNYWGYSTHSFYSPHPGYCVTPLQGSHRTEFRDMVKALHQAGIAVIMDVVFNHTSEGGKDGPLINFKGLLNESFYHLDEHDRSRYRDYTGCGNTVNCNHPLVARFIVECLEYWVREMHVDAFRFDLASVLARGVDGEPDHLAQVIWGIEFSDVLARTGLIAEAWDAGGLYQVGGFPGFRWAEWNGRYRDLVRRFVRGDKGISSDLATCLCGSSDLYEPSGRLPINSVNFVTCHDGFSLLDMVSYNEKHNLANGEDNRDGCNQNLSWNCGTEGDTDDPELLALRHRQVKSFFAVLLLSHGLPMILAGDEVLRSQQGNNNCYCQDNELSWFDWELVERNHEMFRFVKGMIAFRKRHPNLMRRRFVSGDKQDGQRMADITWHGNKVGKPPWSEGAAGETLAYTLSGGGSEEDIHVALNNSAELEKVELPKLSKRNWCLAIDTAAASPADVLVSAQQQPYTGKYFQLSPRSIVVFESRPVNRGRI